jgi:DNA modification methylase
MSTNRSNSNVSGTWSTSLSLLPALTSMIADQRRTASLPPTFEVRIGDCVRSLKAMPSGSVQSAVTSPPYWNLRDYGADGQLGLEGTPQAYLANMVAVFRELRRVLRDDGTLWLNIGDSYSNKNLSGWCKGSELVGMPWHLAFALQQDGWYLRSEVIWHKPNPMPESVKNRPTRCHEQVFLFSKNRKYAYDATAIEEPAIWADDKRSGAGRIRYGGKRNGDAGTGQESFVSIKATRNKRTVWQVAVQHFKGAHFAVFPEKLVEPCLLAGTQPGDIVVDPFSGSGTTGVVAVRHGRHFVGLELNPEYAQMATDRILNAIETPLISVFPWKWDNLPGNRTRRSS